MRISSEHFRSLAIIFLLEHFSSLVALWEVLFGTMKGNKKAIVLYI